MPSLNQSASARIANTAATRVNLIPNPSFEADTIGTIPNGWTNASNSGTTTTKGAANDFAQYGTQSAKIVASGSVVQAFNQNFTLITGQTYTFSAWVKTDALVTNAALVVYDNGNVSEVHVAASTSGRISTTFTVGNPTGVVTVSLGLGYYTGGASAGTVWFDGALLELGSTANSYFDGSFKGAVWTGTANASTSVMTGAVQSAVARITKKGVSRANLMPNPRLTSADGFRPIRGAGYSPGGIGSISNTGGVQTINVTSENGGNHLFGVMLTTNYIYGNLDPAGTQFTASFDVDTLVLNGATNLQFYMEFQNGNGAQTTYTQGIITTTGRKYFTFTSLYTVDRFDVYVFFKMPVSWTGNATAVFKNVMVEKGTASLPYFDGNSPNASWYGAVDNSVSAYIGSVQTATARIATNPTATQSATARIATNIAPTALFNGDFEIAPATNVPQTTSSAWIDGTAGGSVGNVYNWAFLAKLGTAAVMFDNSTSHSGLYSMKLSTTSVGSQAQVSTVKLTTLAGMATAIPARPNTKYTMTYWMKTNLISGSAGNGAYGTISTRDGTGALIAESVSTPVTTTTGWTKYSTSITTGATIQFITPKVEIVGNDGAATLIMDAWFDDIVIFSNAQQPAVARVANNVTAAQNAKARIAITGKSRKNWVTNPNLETDITGWAVGGFPNSGSTAQSSAWSHSGTNSVLATGTLDNSGNHGFGGVVVPVNAPLVIGQTYTVSAYVNINDLGGGSNFAYIKFYWGISSSSGASTQTLGAQRLSVTATAPVGATTLQVQIFVSGTSGTTPYSFYADDALLEIAPSAGSYFDGNTPNGSWVGTANASNSVISGMQQTALARIAKTVTATQPATAHITSLVATTQTAKASIINTPVKNQTAIARIAVTGVPNTNIAKYSQQFSSWSNNLGGTIINNAYEAPDGTITAGSLTSAGSGTGRYITNVTVIGRTYTHSLYVKYVSGGVAWKIGTDVFNITVDTQVGTKISTVGAITAWAVTPVGNGWYRVSVSYVATIAGHAFVIYGSGTAGTMAAWGAQLEANTGPNTYIPTINATPVTFIGARQPSLARIASIPSLTTTAITRIANNRTNTQPSIARVAKINTAIQSAISRIVKSLVKTQSATARIAAKFAKTQPTIARISKTPTSTQSATARIKKITTATQTSTGRIKAIANSTQPATARILYYNHVYYVDIQTPKAINVSVQPIKAINVDVQIPKTIW